MVEPPLCPGITASTFRIPLPEVGEDLTPKVGMPAVKLMRE